MLLWGVYKRHYSTVNNQWHWFPLILFKEVQTIFSGFKKQLRGSTWFVRHLSTNWGFPFPLSSLWYLIREVCPCEMRKNCITYWVQQSYRDNPWWLFRLSGCIQKNEKSSAHTKEPCLHRTLSKRFCHSNDKHESLLKSGINALRLSLLWTVPTCLTLAFPNGKSQHYVSMIGKMAPFYWPVAAFKIDFLRSEEIQYLRETVESTLNLNVLISSKTAKLKIHSPSILV